MQTHGFDEEIWVVDCENNTFYGMFNHGHEDEMAAIMQTFLIQLACYNSNSLKFATKV